MAFVTIHEFEGGTRDQYEAAVGVVHPPEGLPPGQTHHYAGPSADGWVVVAAWDSKELWDKFREETLMPGLGGLGDTGFPAPPKETEFEVEVDV